MRGRGDREHLQAHRLELRADELGELLGLRHIHLVEDDDAGAFRDRDRAQRQLQLVGVFGQLVLKRLVVGDRVAVRLQRGAVDDVGDDLGALDVAQELQAQALALGGARDQAGHVRDRVAAVAGHDHAQVRHQRGERVVRDLRLGGAHRGHQARLAGAREPHQRHVGDGLEFQDHVAFLARFAEQREARGAARLVGQGDVAQTAGAARRGHEPVAVMAQVGQLFAGPLRRALGPARLEDHRAHRHRQDQVIPLGPVLVIPHAHRAVARRAVRHEPVVQQAVGVLVGHEDDGTAVAAIAAVRAGQRLVLLTADAGRTVTAVAALDMDDHTIHKITHSCLPYRVPLPAAEDTKNRIP